MRTCDGLLGSRWPLDRGQVWGLGPRGQSERQRLLRGAGRRDDPDREGSGAELSGSVLMFQCALVTNSLL
eukprot:1196939-Prymnesium_polylepis.1